MYPRNSPLTIGYEIFTIDTGSDLTYLDATFYDPLINDVHSFITFVITRLNFIVFEMIPIYCKFIVNGMKFKYLQHDNYLLDFLYGTFQPQILVKHLGSSLMSMQWRKDILPPLMTFNS